MPKQLSSVTPMFSLFPPSFPVFAENSGIAANINYTTTSFSFPTNYPFQSYAARFPSPGTTSGFGNINKALYYSTIIGGKVKLITMNNYVPFHEGTPQYKWAMREFASVDRTKTPWLFVMVSGLLLHYIL